MMFPGPADILRWVLRQADLSLGPTPSLTSYVILGRLPNPFMTLLPYLKAEMII